MSVQRKMQINGQLSRYYYYEFKHNGKRYRGTTGKETEGEAKAFEKQRKEEIRLLERSSVSDKAAERSLLNFREKVTDQIKGSSVLLDGAWELFRKEAPSLMRKQPGEKMWKAKERYWLDFYEFLKDKSDAKTLRDVKATHAREYVGYLKQFGKYKKDVSYEGKNYRNTLTSLSASTINTYMIHIKQVFDVLKEQAGLITNPFDDIPRMTVKDKPREVFSTEELLKMLEFTYENKGKLPLSSDYKLDQEILEAIFIIGFNTGMRRSDISLLKWEHVDFHKKAVSKVMEKTQFSVFVPMTNGLYVFLKDKYAKRTSDDYVTPSLAKMYKENSFGISYRFKKMLRHLGIESLKAHDGRSRKTSVKDIHSLRHTFCYLHGVQGTPLVTLQSMVGHMDKRMTEAYMMHQTEELKRNAINLYSMTSLLPEKKESLGKIVIQDNKQDQSQSRGEFKF